MAQGEKGRPKREWTDLPKGWEDEFLNLYKKGASDVEIIAWIADRTGSCSRDLFYRWVTEPGHFSDTVKKGRLMSQSWWERQGRENLHDWAEFKGTVKKFNAVLWFMNMKNRFREDWRDNHEITHSGSIQTTPAVIKLGGQEIQVATLNRPDTAKTPEASE